MRLNTWDSIIEHLGKIRDAAGEEEKIPLLIELLINMRLLGQDSCIPDLRQKKGDVETIYASIEAATKDMLAGTRQASANYIYYLREVVKKLPVRQGAEEIIEQIRASAEAFEENRNEDDPLRGFAGDMRKEVHRRLSPRIIQSFLEPYLALVMDGNPEPIVKAGYVALPHFFDPDDEDGLFIDLAKDLVEKLGYLWDYETGNLAAVKGQLEQNLELFERCFLKMEVLGFLELLTPANLADPLLELDLLKRLASFKHDLKESQQEARISLFDFLMLDLSLGRLVFLLANDLTNNHFAEVTPRNLRDALAVIRELLNISTVKGLAIGDVVRHQAELDALRESSVYDFLKAKRELGAICKELQRYLQSDIIDRMSGTLNRILEEYEVPTSRLSSNKTRFFNNFIRRTQIHVLSEFTEKAAAAVDAELARQTGDRQLYAEFAARNPAAEQKPEEFIATTWGGAEDSIRFALGGKGNSIIDMARLDLSVPPAFVIGYPFFSVCGREPSPGGTLDAARESIVREQVAKLERIAGRKLGDPAHPLLVSVRSGAPTSMPGVMATILNVGWTPEVKTAMEHRRGIGLTAVLYRRFLENCISALASGSSPDALEEQQQAGSTKARPMPAIAAMEETLLLAFGPEFFKDPHEQLLRCILLVYASRASRAVRAYSSTMATGQVAETAVTVQQLVFGNLNQRSLSGVLITRNPITGANELFGEFKRAAQGEEVVMGSSGTEPMQHLDPEIALQLVHAKQLLTRHYRQDLDLEFTVEDGELFLLQARSARLGAFAQLVADTDFLAQGIISIDEYRRRIEHLELAYDSVALPRADFKRRTWNPPLTVGVPINGGVVSGTLVLSEERLKEADERRESVVFFANSTKPTDFAVMNGAQAIVTVYPGRTSHAAITAMSMNKPCIVGCADVEIDYDMRRVIFHGAGGVFLNEGERVTADGNTGSVYRGVAPISEFYLPVAEVSEALAACAHSQQAAKAVNALIDDSLARLYRETRLKRAGLEQLPALDGARVLVRADFNVGPAGSADDREARVRQLHPTIEAILARGGTPLLCSHLGDPGSRVDTAATREQIYEAYSLAPFAAILARQYGNRFVFHPTSVATSGLLIGRDELTPGFIHLLENLRFATGERDNDDAFSRALAGLSDGWYVNNAFNVCGRRHASITGVPKFCARCLAGHRVTQELAVLETLLESPGQPFLAVFAGSDADSRSGVMSALLPRLNCLAILEPRERAEQLAATVRASSSSDRIKEKDSMKQLLVVDPSRERNQGEYSQLLHRIAEAGTILWSGPAGLSEIDGAGETRDPLIQALRSAVSRGALLVVCSETEKHIAKPHVPGLHISSGPSAFLEYLERLSLPGITALDPGDE
jgi:3-phosphoglycerate kinase/phosphohistidine swiveling domain-containing protein